MSERFVDDYTSYLVAFRHQGISYKIPTVCYNFQPFFLAYLPIHCINYVFKAKIILFYNKTLCLKNRMESTKNRLDFAMVDTGKESFGRSSDGVGNSSGGNEGISCDHVYKDISKKTESDTEDSEITGRNIGKDEDGLGNSEMPSDDEIVELVRNNKNVSFAMLNFSF